MTLCQSWFFLYPPPAAYGATFLGWWPCWGSWQPGVSWCRGLWTVLAGASLERTGKRVFWTLFSVVMCLGWSLGLLSLMRSPSLST